MRAIDLMPANGQKVAAKNHHLMQKILLIAGARPNFMKVAPIYAEMKRRGDAFAPMIVHTGQHYDKAMSDAFFSDLGMPQPDINLGVGSASHTQQTAKIMTLFEPVVEAERPDWVVVVGDVNSTIACALVAAKMGVKIAHVEAGLRSDDRTMPEEINRILTDSISDLLLTPSPDANQTLLREGVDESKICFVGNVMIDSLLGHLKVAERSNIRETLGLSAGEYAVTTLHRPSNVDDRETFGGIVGALAEVSKRLPIIFPVHPRTRQKLTEFGFDEMITGSQVQLIEPLGYLDFLRLYSGAKLVLTDSGGLQEETTVLGLPCLTLRENTERPITIEMGSNVLVGVDPAKILAEAYTSLDGQKRDLQIPPLWDGKTAARICDALERPAA